eukprot:UN25268
MQDVKHYEMTKHDKYNLGDRDMDGRLVDNKDKIIREFDKGKPCILSIQEILEVSETKLDDVSELNSNETLRSSGIILLVLLEYDNTYSLSNRTPRYTFRVNRVHNQENKIVETTVINSTDRILRDRH